MVDMNFVVCGWYTPDYEHWFERLEESLIEHETPYDFQEVPKLDGGWERNTCRKPEFILNALETHPEKTIIFVDVDAIVRGDVKTLVDLPCDIALNLEGTRKKRRIMLRPRTGTVVLNRTKMTKILVESWVKQCQSAAFGFTDEDCLVLALGSLEGIGILNIGPTANGVIIHSVASAEQKKVTKLQKIMHAATSVFAARLIGSHS